MSWCEVISNIEPNSTIYKEGIEAVNFSINEMNSDYGKSFFEEELPLKYGAFYKGWSTYVLGKKLETQTVETRSLVDINQFQLNCEEIIFALSKSNSPYLESYSGLAWPADMILCMASLNLHDVLFATKYKNIITTWLTEIQERLDKYELIPHAVDAKTGYPTINSRGNSQSLILSFLPDIDGIFAQAQFSKYKTLFKERRFGLLGIRHYPKQTKGAGDIDSGPVILGIGGAASIVGQRAFAKQKDWQTYTSLRNSIESFGVPLCIDSKKRYVFGQMPMADAFICWSNSIEKSINQVPVKTNWRFRFQFFSVTLSIVIIFMLNQIGSFAFVKRNKAAK